jgi:hypothetical protein
VPLWSVSIASSICLASQNRPPAVPSISCHGLPATSANSSSRAKNSTWIWCLASSPGPARPTRPICAPASIGFYSE